MNDRVENIVLKKPLAKRFKALALSFIVSFTIGLVAAVLFIVAYSVEYYGPDRMVWGIYQAIMPESEVKQELVKLQSELHHANGKLSDITRAIASARKLGTGGTSNLSDARARLSNPTPALESVSETKPKSKLKNPAQGGGAEEPLSVLDTLLYRLQGIQTNPVQLESKKYFSFLQSTPIGVPVSGELTSEFGFRTSPFSGFRQAHRGIDVAMNRGAELFATADGTVEVAGWGGAYGNYIIIDHGAGPDGSRFETLYAHLSKIYMKPGAHVLRGEKIGQVGTSGHSTGPHVHYEVRKNGVAIDPEPFVQLASLLD